MEIVTKKNISLRDFSRQLSDISPTFKPYPMLIYYHDESDINVLMGPHDLKILPTREEINRLTRDLQKLYSSITDDEIEEYNSGLRDNEPETHHRLYPIPMPGYIYVVKASGNGHAEAYKIGVTTDPKKRMDSIRRSDWVRDRYGDLGVSKCEFIVKAEIDNPYKREKELHSKFSEHRISREWFELSEEDISEIKRIIEVMRLSGNGNHA